MLMTSQFSGSAVIGKGRMWFVIKLLRLSNNLTDDSKTFCEEDSVTKQPMCFFIK